MTRIPIRIRVAAAFAAAMLLVLAGTGLVLYVRIGHELTVALDRELELRAFDLTAVVQDRDVTLATARGGRFVERGEAYAQLVDASGRVVDATRPLGAAAVLDAAQLRAAMHGTIFANAPSLPGLDEPSRFLATPITRSGRRLVLVVGATRQNRAETLAGLRTELLIAGPVALVLATLAGYVLAGLSLRQVDSMRRRAESISAATPGERLPVPQTRDEIQRLGETLNAMLGRLEAALEHERGFVADAGHELRTPLALLRTELELALRHAESADELREAIRKSSVEVDRLAQLAEDLLLIAQAQSGRLPLRLEPLAPAELLESTASRFEWRAQQAGRTVTVEPGTAAPFQGDSIRLEQALGNMIDNALRHGEGDVHLAAATANRTVELHVTDAGSGLPEAFAEHAFERFSRPDPSRGGGGAGLGLAIVQMIAQAHGGSAHVANRPGGGADVWMALPVGPLTIP